MEIQEKEQITRLMQYFVEALSPLKIYLFGSFAEGTANKDSDYDFYIIVDNEEKDIFGLTKKAYKSIRGKKNRPVDIVVGREGNFEERKDWILSLEKEVNDKGILLYDVEKGFRSV